jgi:hypothetical protein
VGLEDGYLLYNNGKRLIEEATKLRLVGYVLETKNFIIGIVLDKGQPMFQHNYGGFSEWPHDRKR